MIFYLGLGIFVILSIYCWLGAKKAYDKGEILPLRVSIAVWILDTIHALLVIISSLYTVWPLPLNKTAVIISGLALILIGLVIMLIGMIKFRSLRKISGLDTSRLISTGIYGWSRNPQYMGWFLVLIGISLMGRSGLAFLLTIIAIIAMHLYVIWLEEPYLERIFGEEYRLYQSRVPRYLGIGKK
jgi:protein-S-isoprenylcysteine O-methyltransferase Ste14